MTSASPARSLYTTDERRRRDESGWTLVQGVLAPVQFLAFGISLFLVLRALATGDGYVAATASVIVKTAILYAIMVTGAIWEKTVFGRYLFAPAFWWEDAVSIVVLALHTLYIAALIGGWLGREALLLLALAAYGTYLVNAAQYVLKFRLARQSAAESTPVTT